MKWRQLDDYENKVEERLNEVREDLAKLSKSCL